MAFFKIPGNVKLKLVPFVLDPSAKINDLATKSSDELAGASPLLFTFRPAAQNIGGGLGIINVCPISFKKYINSDVGYKMLMPYIQNSGKKDLGKEYNISDFMNSIPGVQIREFLPDTRLELFINFMTTIGNIVTTMATMAKDAMKSHVNRQQAPSQDGKSKDFFLLLKDAVNWTFGYLIGDGEESLMHDIKTPVESMNAAATYAGIGDENADLKNYVLNFPYMLYYCFLSSVTTNIYELPCVIDSKSMYSSDGANGWSKGGELAIVNNTASMLPGRVGTLLKGILGNIAINYLPWWDAATGSLTPDEEIKISFDLFNDTAEGTIINFIFVNTLIPNNKWIQYNVFQHSSSLYDIKLEGYNRLFACTGKFNVTYKGVLRQPSHALLTELLKKKNKCFSGSEDVILKQRMIMIPDVYHVEMTFTSVLPANFNTFIFQYSNNNNQIEKMSSSKAYSKSVALEAIDKGVKSFEGKFSNYWKDLSFPDPDVKL